MKKTLLLFIVILANNLANAQWTTQNTGFAVASRGINEIRIVDADNVWALAYDGSVLTNNVQEFTRTTNGGTTWTSGVINVSNTDLKITNISPVSGTTAWVGAFDNVNGLGGVWKTTDGGNTWTQQNASAYTTSGVSWFNAVHFYNANTGITFGDPLSNGKFEIYKTTDGGATWTAITTVSAASGEYGYNGGLVAAGNSLWFTTNKGKLLRTTDMGATWTKLNTPLSDFGATAVNGRAYFSDDNNGVILGTTNSGTTIKLWKTTNGGSTWDAGTTYTGGYNRLLSYIPGTNTLVATGASTTAPAVPGSAYSNDNGTTWTSIDTGTQRGYVAMLNSTTGWCGGFNTSSTVGGIFKYSGVALATNDFEKTSNVISCYPNPSKNLIHVDAKEAIESLSIFDIVGNQIYTSKSLINNNSSIDISNFSNGVYFLKVALQNNSLQTIKIIKE
ncbi:T9SS type A sorting domain-containing protein [Flavobacterium branchiophilum]|uniref:Secretion system C-terminal sorting domain-containing protein n=1 Tax=Flavobacterium branchiophilum TaxID=55197 RepID=A0A2H3KEA6_9FLAO|nr:T9SS type A sorting domain-containing protein [Flavobacterium branchiophilum]PDS26522.1 hypothetical protein B0A77_02165 [Flavobacterium branchiophilum]